MSTTLSLVGKDKESVAKMLEEMFHGDPTVKLTPIESAATKSATPRDEDCSEETKGGAIASTAAFILDKVGPAADAASSVLGGISRLGSKLEIDFEFDDGSQHLKFGLKGLKADLAQTLIKELTKQLEHKP